MTNKLTEIKEKLNEYRRPMANPKIDWLITQLTASLAREEMLLAALEFCARTTYGTELCNTDAENNEILAGHYWSCYNKACETKAEHKSALEKQDGSKK